MPKTTDKGKAQVETFDRWFALERSSLDEDSRELEMSFSSDAPVERWFGWEVLRHNRKAVDLRYLREGGSFLFNHDRDRLVGPIKSVRVDGNKLRATVGFDETDEGGLRWRQVQSGSLRGVSIRYSYGASDYRDVADGEKEYGRPGPGRDVKRWAPIHLTLATEPADASVGVGRSRDDEGDNEADPTDRAGDTGQQGGNEMPETKPDEKPAETAQLTAPAGEKDDAQRKRGNDGGDELSAAAERGAAKEAERQLFIRNVAKIAALEELGEKLAADRSVTIEDAHKRLAAEWGKRKEGDAPVGAASPKTEGRRFADVDGDTLNRTLCRRGWSEASDHDEVLRLGDLRGLFKADPKGFDRRLKTAFASGDLRPEQFSLRACYEALGDVPCVQLVHDARLGEERAMTTTAFAVLTGNTVVSKLRDAYDNVPKIGDKLTSPFKSSQSTDTIVGINLADAIKPVDEGKAYEEAGGTEEYVTVGHRKQGGLIRVTDEMVRFDQTGQFLSRINDLGEQAGLTIEKLTIYRVCDDQGFDGRYVYHPSGTATALYSATARARGTNLKQANALVDTTDLAAARALLAAMTNRSGGDKINVQPKVLLVPDALIGTALTLRGSELMPGTVNELNPWGTRGQWQPTVLSSPEMDSISTSTWYLGDPQRQFKRKELIALETTQQGASAEAMFTHDIVAQFKVRFDYEVFCDDYVYFVENTA